MHHHGDCAGQLLLSRATISAKSFCQFLLANQCLQLLRNHDSRREPPPLVVKILRCSRHDPASVLGSNLGSANRVSHSRSIYLFRIKGLRGRPGGLAIAPIDQASSLANPEKSTTEFIGRNACAANLDPARSGTWVHVADAAKPHVTLQPEDHRMRAELAAQLAEAIAEAHPDDACQIMTAALTDLSAGLPPAHPFVSAEEDAAWWVSEAAPAQLAAVLAAVLKRLTDRALHLNMHKRLFWVLWRSFTEADKRRFLTFAKGEV